jgi:hypothetical protein
MTADGQPIPRNGYRLEDFVDDDIDGELNGPFDTSYEEFCTTAAQRQRGHGEVREAAAVYRIRGA